MTPSEFEAQAVANATISSATVTGSVTISNANVTCNLLTIQGTIQFAPGATGSKLLNSSAQGFYIFGADDIRLEGNTFDGLGIVSQNLIWDSPAGNTPDGFVILNNTFENFYDDADPSTHSEAIFVGYSTNGSIQGNTFTDNGNTSHIFFSWWGETANPATSYPRNMCVSGNTFNETHGAFYDVNLREEIPVSANIKVQLDASISDTRFHGVCPGTAPAFSIPTYEIHVRPNHEHGSDIGSNNNHLWLLHTSPSSPIGSWGGVACRGVNTAQSYEYWHAFEFKIDANWNTSLQGEYGTMIPDFHTKVGEVASMPGPGPYYLSYRLGNLYVQLQAEFPNHARQVAANLSKGVWHSVLARIIMGRTDGSVSASGHPNGGMGRIFLWLDGNDTPQDSGNVTTLYRTSGGVVQSQLDILEGFYTRNAQQDDVFSMTAGRWGKTLSQCLADSAITLTGSQIANIYRGSGANLGPSSYTTLAPRFSTDFLTPPSLGGVPAPSGGNTGRWTSAVQWNAGGVAPSVLEATHRWTTAVQWNAGGAPASVPEGEPSLTLTAESADVLILTAETT